MIFYNAVKSVLLKDSSLVKCDTLLLGENFPKFEESPGNPRLEYSVTPLRTSLLTVLNRSVILVFGR